MRWGLVPVWAKDLKVGYRMINAKAENLESSRAYAPLVGKFRHRCLIVADGFYEFTAPEDPKKKRKDKWLFTLAGEAWFGIAGLWREHPEVGEAYTMLTCPPGPDVAPYHDRQVVVLGPGEWARWLDPAVPAAELLRPLPGGSLEVEQVG
mgnify:CR=1 FL=1